MKSDLKQLGKETAIYGISTILSRFLNFLLVPFFTNIFTQAEYGIITNVYAYIAFLNIIYLYGMDSAYLKFSASKEFGSEKETFSSAFNSVFLSSFIFSLIIIILQNPLAKLFGINENQMVIVYFISGTLFFDSISNIIFARLRFHNKALKFAGIKTFNIIVNVTLNVILIYFLKFRSEGVFIANFSASFLTFIFLGNELFKSYTFTLRKELLKGLVKFGLPFVPAGIASIITQVIDRPILLALTDASTVGIYQANYKLGIFMMLYVSMFQYAWQPFYLKKSEQENAKKLFAKVFTYFTLIGSIIFLVLSLYIEEIVKIRILGFYLVGKDFWGGINIVPVVLLGYLFNGFYINFVAGLQIQKKTHFMPLVSGLGAIVNVFTNLLLIPLFGMLGAAYATLLAYLAMAVYQYFLSQKFYKIDYEWNNIIKISLILIFVFTLYFIIKINFTDYTTSLKIVIILLYILLLKIFNLISFRWFSDFFNDFLKLKKNNKDNF